MAIGLINDFLWGAPSLILILTVGLFLSIRLHFVQLTKFPAAMGMFLQKLLAGGKQKRDTSPGFRELCTALAATVGTGNLVGVAGAICLGGPGAIFWMWLCGILGMVTKYAEATLAVRFQVSSKEGCLGGPMHIMERGLGSRWKPMASVYSLFGLIASFGVGNGAQVNAVITGINSVQSRFNRQITPVGNLLMGILLATLVGALLFGGVKRITLATERLVPLAALLYILLCCGCLLVRADRIPAAVRAIVRGAFSPKAVTGGMLGSGFRALRVGCARGVFTNEAGMGTAAIAHGAAKVDHPVQQGLMGIVEVFLDTILICTLTALVILTSGVPVPYGTDAGAQLTSQAFASVYGDAAAIFLALAMSLFAVATILGWGLYGAGCAQYLFGDRVWKLYALAQTGAVVLSSVLDTAFVWQISEAFNGLMVIPNLIALAALSPEVVRLTKEYINSGGMTAGGGKYADFHQCKPL